jgi:hypothetical protein
MNFHSILVGFAAVNNFALNKHSLWSTFSSQTGYRSLNYAVLYTVKDSTLFVSGMSAVIGFTRINCSNTLDDFNIDSKIITITSYSVDFVVYLYGNTQCQNLVVDILVISSSRKSNFNFFFLI